jgi:GntR family transcriptional repressor for pyruvate dehydrogenase complex
MVRNELSVRKLSDAIVANLEKRILEGVIKAGDKLPPERELAASLGVSRTALREAIQKLGSRGLLLSRQGGGTFVTDSLEASLAGPWQGLLAGHPELRDDLLECRRALLAQLAEWAASRRTAEELSLLAACADAWGNEAANAVAVSSSAASQRDVARQDDAGEQALAADDAFHQALFEAAHNVFAAHVMAALSRLLHADMALAFEALAHAPAAFSLLRDQYRAIFTAVRDQNPQAARAAVCLHGDFIRETLLDALRSASRRDAAASRLSRPL